MTATHQATLTRRRKPLDAACLSALLPGLGHLYCGQFQRGILWMGASVTLVIAAVVTLVLSPTRDGLQLAACFLVADLIVWGLCTYQSWRLARHLEPDYELREYNRWYVYAVLMLLCGFGSAVGFAFVLHERVIQAFVIPSHSMEPTIRHGDRILTLKETYLDRDPQRGELVVFRNPDNRRQFYIKRIIAIAGDHIEWQDDGKVTVNDTPLIQTSTSSQGIFTEANGDHRYRIKLTSSIDTGNAAMGSLIVPPHHCFVLGDNRLNSRDSRHFGSIAYTSLVADPVAKVWGGLGKLE